MNRISICALLLFCGSVTAMPLYDLIKQNVQRSTQTFDDTSAYARRPVAAAQIWVHIRNDGQKKLADEILGSLGSQHFEQRNIEQKPVQRVDYGPRKSQLRYFKRQDQQQAEELFAALRRQIPQLELNDASGRFQNVDWIKPGHYELWLAPDLSALRQP